MPYDDAMTDHPIPHPGEATEKVRRQLYEHPEDFARDLADQHFAEALDMLTENAREVLVEAIYDDLRMTISNSLFEHILGAYHDRLAQWFEVTPTTLDEEDA